MNSVAQTQKTGIIGHVKSFIWNLFPIYKNELKKFVPMALMMLFVLFNYTVLRNAKDALVTTAQGADESIIPFLKLYGTLPAAMLFVLFYTKVSNYFSREKIFYMCIGTFVSFFALFGFVIYPNISMMHPSIETVQSLQNSYPYFKWFIAMWGNWSFCLFFVFAELWGSAILSLFFWQFANEITPSSEAKRFYPLFGFVGNIGLVLAGHIGESIANGSSGQGAMEHSMYILMGMLVVSGVAITALYWFVNRVVEAEPKEPELVKPKKSKPKLGMVESLRYVFSSPHILCIALLVLSYGITINFIDVIWKGQVRILVEGDQNKFLAYMASFSKITGYISLPLMLIGGNLLRRLSWRNAASIVPLMLMGMSLMFYGLVIYGDMIGMTAPMITAYGLSFTGVQLAAGIGKWQGALTKASKYSLFDSTKEMAYIPLDPELKSKGKAAVDVTGGRLGKSGGSWTISTLKIMFPGTSTQALAPYLAGVSAVVFVIWIGAVLSLSRRLKVIDDSQEQEKMAEAA